MQFGGVRFMIIMHNISTKSNGKKSQMAGDFSRLIFQWVIPTDVNHSRHSILKNFAAADDDALLVNVS